MQNNEKNISFLTICDMAKIIKCHPATIRRKLPQMIPFGAFRFGGQGKWLMAEDSFLRFLNS